MPGFETRNTYATAPERGFNHSDAVVPVDVGLDQENDMAMRRAGQEIGINAPAMRLWRCEAETRTATAAASNASSVADEHRNGSLEILNGVVDVFDRELEPGLEVVPGCNETRQRERRKRADADYWNASGR